MQDPETPEEWQAALDAIVALLEASAARKFGLATVNVGRCGHILRRATALGYRPSKPGPERTTLKDSPSMAT